MPNNIFLNQNYSSKWYFMRAIKPGDNTVDAYYLELWLQWIDLFIRAWINRSTKSELIRKYPAYLSLSLSLSCSPRCCVCVYPLFYYWFVRFTSWCLVLQSQGASSVVICALRRHRGSHVKGIKNLQTDRQMSKVTRYFSLIIFVFMKFIVSHFK